MNRRSTAAGDGDEGLRWSEFQSRLRGYVASRVDPAWTDDVTGDILLRLLEKKERLEQARNPLAWAYRVAANTITDHYRRRAVESRALARAQAEATSPAPAADAKERKAERRRIEACLMPFILDLSPQQAEALLLTSFQGLSQAEAARRLGLSVSGMKSRVQRARAELKRRLLACCEFEMDRRGRVMGMVPRSVSRVPECPGGDGVNSPTAARRSDTSRSLATRFHPDRGVAPPGPPTSNREGQIPEGAREC